MGQTRIIHSFLYFMWRPAYDSFLLNIAWYEVVFAQSINKSLSRPWEQTSCRYFLSYTIYFISKDQPGFTPLTLRGLILYQDIYEFKQLIMWIRFVHYLLLFKFFEQFMVHLKLMKHQRKKGIVYGIWLIHGSRDKESS